MPNFPLTYPTNTKLAPKSIDFTSKTIATQFRSPYTGKTQTYRYGGQWWELTVTYAPLFQTDAEELTGFLNALAGTSGTFTYKLPSKFMISANVGISTTATGYDGSSNRLVQFTTATSLFPKLSPSISYTINTTSGTNLRLATNDINFSVDEMMLTGITVPFVEAI